MGKPMPDTDYAPAIFAATDRHALSSPILTDQQRAEALQAIALVRELSPDFLGKAEQIIANGTMDFTALFNTAIAGAQVDTAMTRVLRALWVMEDAVFQARNAEIATMSKAMDVLNA